MEELANAIVSLFPGEVKTTYYVPRGTKSRPCGKIHDRYYNATAKKRRSDCSQPKQNDVDVETNKNLTNLSTDMLQYFNEKKIWLVHNIPTNINELWEKTSEMRMNEKKENLDKIFQEWPRFKDAMGYELIDIDFNTLHPGKGKKIFEKIIPFQQIMFSTIFPSLIKDKLNIQNFEKIKEIGDLNTDARHFHLLNFMHAVLLPPRINKTCKPSISDGQKDMIIYVRNINNLKQKEDELRAVALKEKITIQPKIIVIGDCVNNLKEFYVYLNGVQYKAPSLLRAIDILIKACFVFNLEYSQKSKYVWMFLQEYFYDIPPIEKVPKIKNLINKLQE